MNIEIEVVIDRLAICVARFNANSDRTNLNCNRNPSNRNPEHGIVQSGHLYKIMKNYDNLYPEIYLIQNLILAWRKARKGKTKKNYVKEFEQNIRKNLLKLRDELKNQTYSPEPLKIFILRDPKTRKISKSDFRDRIVHHALVGVLEPIFNKIFICDNCASRKNKGNLFAINRFEKFQRKVTNNLTSGGYCLKADIKHYFQEINHEVLLNILRRKIKCEKTIWLLKRIIERKRETRTIP